MSCWLPGIRTKLLLYVEGTLTLRDAEKVERHLLACSRCREVLVRLRAGRRIARQIPRISPGEYSQGGFESFVARVAANAERPRRTFLSWRERLDRWATPQVVAALIAVVLVQLALLVFSNRKTLLGERSFVARKASAFYLQGFRPISIQNVRLDTQPHIVTEGYAEDVHTDKREGVVAFRLVEHRRSMTPFLRCEIMRPLELAPPKNGAYIRVYGVSRYDAQEGHGWYEVNPVVKITPAAHRSGGPLGGR
ncbi:MAG TPA: zf-HC2 domain-containing protein [Terriglobia bacterium]|nr:zf-HC2 domain-containing protein [Terriglobia bacterium]